ncbi:ABC transporter ATP-binding protein [Kitasatospora cathayae]|uniref:ABC transporter ATP-binding protein n=1 Tax=Kitasatospora cathayae TaxID=3004092 RepID=A0ABY7QG52_9ACTN|nr:ABC transporter ATP-binding protein [Kitasatospora sp. HUAS 3-15]WBP91399.1 ABC transporter ATP-binding protein [Kitasatospora sp. HUAS 3-15]
MRFLPGDTERNPRLLIPVLRFAFRAAPIPAAGYLAFSALGGVIPTAVAWATKGLLDGLATAPGGSASEILRKSSFLAALGVASAVLPRLARYWQTRTQRAARLWLRDQLFQALNRLRDITWFENPVSLDRIQLALNASTTSPELLLGAVVSSFQAVITIVGLLGSLWIISPVVFGLIALSSLPVVFSQLMQSREQIGLAERTVQASRREIFYRSVITSVNAVKEIRIFGLGDFFRERMNDETRSINRAEERLELRSVRRQAALAMFSAVIVGACVVWSATRVADRQVSIGDLSVFIAAAAGVQGAVLQLATGIGDGYRSLLAFENYQRIVTTAPVAEDSPTRMAPLSGDIEVNDLWFRHSEDTDWILKGVNLRLAAGKATALVGLNGAGKSTLVKLLCGLYEPTRGSILVGGRDIRTLPRQEYQRGITAIFQDYMCYDLTAAQNISLGDLDRFNDRAAVRAAAVKAGADEYLAELPNGYDTMLSRIFFAGDSATNRVSQVHLSGGQWQRVAVARGLMRHDSYLVILDEPSSGLDAEAEASLHEELLRGSAGSTRLLISHRLSAVKDADAIAVIVDGRIAELGDHRELMAVGGTYHRLFTLQASGYADAGR